jgi:branched-chain amino acid transport system permease protein
MPDAALLGQLLVNGLSIGFGYGLAAVGLALIFGIIAQVNFAHGEIYMLGAFVLYALVERIGLPVAAGSALTVAMMAGVGLALAETTLLPTLDRPFEQAILATLAVSMILQNLVRLGFGASPLNIAAPLEGVVIEFGGMLLFGQRLLIAGLALLALAGLAIFLRASRMGRAMRAMAQNRDACLMIGIDPRRVVRITAAISSMLCGLAAVAIAPMHDLYPAMGGDVVFKSFAVVIIGGMGNVAGAIVAGLLLGVAESFAGGLVSTGLRDGVGFALMIAMLLLRPQGIFGRSVRI